jgi:hypothetical protein
MLVCIRKLPLSLSLPIQWYIVVGFGYAHLPFPYLTLPY